MSKSMMAIMKETRFDFVYCFEENFDKAIITTPITPTNFHSMCELLVENKVDIKMVSKTKKTSRFIPTDIVYIDLNCELENASYLIQFEIKQPLDVISSNWIDDTINWINETILEITGELVVLK
jgi:hypothetical protein